MSAEAGNGSRIILSEHILKGVGQLLALIMALVAITIYYSMVNRQQENFAATARKERQQPFLQKQLELYFGPSESTAVLASSRYKTAPAPARDLGIPITAANRVGYKIARGFGKEGHDLLCWTTSAESGGYFSAMDLQTGRVVTHPLNHLEAYPIVAASDGNIYIGSSSGHVMRWNPHTNSWGPLGKPLFAWPGAGLNHVRCLCEGRDKWLYAGSTYGERARVHIKTGEVQKLPPTPEPGNWYVSACVALPDGRIAFGYGHKARVFVYDPAQGKDVSQWLPKGWTEDGFCMTMEVGKSVLYANHFPSGRRAVLDIRTGKFLGQIPWPNGVSGTVWSRWNGLSVPAYYVVPGTDTVFTCVGGKIYQYNPRNPRLPPVVPLKAFKPPASLTMEMRYEVTTDCRVLVYDKLRQKVIRIITPPQPKVSRGLMALGTGPDGKVYGGAYQSTLLFRYDPFTGKMVVLGDHHPGWSGETFSFANRGDEIICASYTNGAMVAYNVKKPWQCTLGKMVNPRLLGFLGQRVYRPYSTCVAEDGKVWAVGPAGWGTTGGGVAYIDPDTKRTESTALPEAPSDILPLSGNRLLLCSGSLLRWWDGKTNRQIAQSAPPAPLHSATLIEIGPPSRILMASGSELLIVSADEPGQVRVLKRFPSPIPCTRALVWQGHAIVGGPRGFAAVHLQTGKANYFCNTPLGGRFAFTIAAEAVYFHSGAHLMAAQITTPFSMEGRRAGDEGQTCFIQTPALQTSPQPSPCKGEKQS